MAADRSRAVRRSFRRPDRMAQEEGSAPCLLDKSLISWRMSSARQAVHRGESLTGLGKRPDLTPSHQLVLPMGITLSTCGSRRNPVSGRSCIAEHRSFATLDCTITKPLMSRRIVGSACVLAPKRSPPSVVERKCWHAPKCPGGSQERPGRMGWNGTRLRTGVSDIVLAHQ
jgi:hypothetical protein